MNMADNGFQNDLFREVAPRKKKPNPLPKIIVMLVLAGVAGFYLFSDNEPTKIISMPKESAAIAESPASSVIQPAPASALKPAASRPVAAVPKTTPKAKSKIEARQNPGDSARAVVAEFRAKKGAANLKQIVKSAEAFKAKGKYTDAYLLYFFAAREGYAPAAQVLARMYDPAHYSKQTSMLDQPDLVQAYKWYRQAARGGQAAAQRELNDFRARMEQLAAGGSAEAKQLALQWQ